MASRLADLQITDDDIGEETPDEVELSEQKRQDAAAVIANLSLDAALDRKTRAALKRHPNLAVVNLPTADWVDIIETAIKTMERAPVIRSVTEMRKVGGVLHRVGADDLRWLQTGRSVLFLSPDPDGLIDHAVLAATDVVITIPRLTPILLRRTIRAVTGGLARGVTERMADLDIDVIISVIRPERSARQCVDGLRRAVDRQSSRGESDVPLLTSLPLTNPIRKWTDQILSDLAAVKSGSMSSDQLVYGVLEGPPGTGKTLIAESLAKTANWTFVPSRVGSWFASGDGALGGVSRNVRGFVNQVLAAEPSIGFLDELDAIPDRGTLDAKGRDWWTPVITLILTEVDRLKRSGRKVLLLGATNYYSRLDSALVRPGRMHQRISVLAPETEAEVVALLRHFLGTELPDADIGKLARFGRGATPASVEGWVKEARGLARSKGRTLETGDVLSQMVPRDDRSPEDVRTIALHEVGHAVVAHRLGHAVKAISIVPEGLSGGRTETRLQTIVPTWPRICDSVTIALGGRAADVALGIGANAGAESDLEAATLMLRLALERQGLGQTLAYAPEIDSRQGDTSKAVEDHLRHLLERAIRIIEQDRDLALGLAKRLAEEKVLDGADVAAALGNVGERRTTKPGEEAKGSAMTPGSAPTLPPS